jgi:hypothetical protein
VLSHHVDMDLIVAPPGPVEGAALVGLRSTAAAISGGKLAPVRGEPTTSSDASDYFPGAIELRSAPPYPEREDQ